MGFHHSTTEIIIFLFLWFCGIVAILIVMKCFFKQPTFESELNCEKQKSTVKEKIN